MRGGVAIYVRDHITVTTLKISNDNPDFELLWIKAQSENRFAIIGVIYHPQTLL